MGLKYCYQGTCSLTFDRKHSMAKIFEVDFAVSIWVQVLGKVLHLKKRAVVSTATTKSQKFKCMRGCVYH